MNLVFVMDQNLVYLQLDPLKVGPQYQQEYGGAEARLSFLIHLPQRHYAAQSQSDTLIDL
jgi:hypothetical protein